MGAMTRRCIVAAGAFAAAVGLVSAFLPPGRLSSGPVFQGGHVATPPSSSTRLPEQCALGPAPRRPRTARVLRPSMMSAAATDVAVGGKVLVSGFLDAKERTDQFVFDVLHAQGVWKKIVAFSPEAAFAKKRLVSRKSRYSGLLDALEFEEGDQADVSTMTEKLKGCDAWLAFGCEASALVGVVEASKAAGIKALVITTAGSAEDIEKSGIAAALEGSGMRYTLIRTGAVREGKEGGPISIRAAGEALPVEEIARDELVRLAAEAFVTGGAANKALSIGTGDDVAAEYLKTLREKGLSRQAEIDAALSGGLTDFYKKKDDEEEAKKKAEVVKAEKDAQRKVLQQQREKETQEWMDKQRVEAEARGAEKAKEVARKVLAREWRSLYWARNTTLSEEEYVAVPENWERGLRKGQKIVAAGSRSGEYSDWEDDDDDDDLPPPPPVSEVVKPPEPLTVPAGGEEKKSD